MAMTPDPPGRCTPCLTRLPGPGVCPRCADRDPPAMPLRESLHVHTWRCGHATGTVADYAASAAAAGMDVLGIADHTPLPDGRWSDIRMRLDELPAHAAEVRAAQAPGLRVLLGMECEPLPEYLAFYREVLLGEAGCDYLVAACHFIGDGAGGWDWPGERAVDPGRYADLCEAAMRCGLFRALAHPDLPGYAPGPWTPAHARMAERIARTAAQTGTALELNAYGLRKPMVDDGAGGQRHVYPWREFWTVAAAFRPPVVVWSDAHRPQDVAHGDELLAYAAALGLRPLGAAELLGR